MKQRKVCWQVALIHMEHAGKAALLSHTWFSDVLDAILVLEQWGYKTDVICSLLLFLLMWICGRILLSYESFYFFLHLTCERIE